MPDRLVLTDRTVFSSAYRPGGEGRSMSGSTPPRGPSTTLSDWLASFDQAGSEEGDDEAALHHNG
jgi:hypothetical protein